MDAADPPIMTSASNAALNATMAAEPLDAAPPNATLDTATPAELAFMKELLEPTKGRSGDRFAAWLAGIENAEVPGTLTNGVPRFFGEGDGIASENGMKTVIVSWGVSPDQELERCWELSTELSAEPLDYEELENTGSLFWLDLAASHKDPATRDWALTYSDVLETEFDTMADDEARRLIPNALAAVERNGVKPIGPLCVRLMFDFVRGVYAEVPLRSDRAHFAPLYWRQYRERQHLRDITHSSCQTCNTPRRIHEPDFVQVYPLCPGCSPVKQAEAEPDRLPCALCRAPTLMRLRLCDDCRPQRAPKSAQN